MSGNYFNPLKREFLNLSGGTVTGDTIFTQSVDISVLTASTIYSASTPLEQVIYKIASGFSGATGNFLNLSGGTGGPYYFTGSTSANTIDTNQIFIGSIGNTATTTTIYGNIIVNGFGLVSEYDILDGGTF